jgi:hypothetical protein
MATATKVQRKAVKQVPVKKFNMNNGEPVGIEMSFENLPPMHIIKKGVKPREFHPVGLEEFSKDPVFEAYGK